MKEHTLIVLITIVLILSGGNVIAGEDRPSDSSGSWFFSFYNKIISPVDGDRCNMHPTCSRYSSESVRKHGLLMGWIMTCDRLIRCGRDNGTSSPVRVNGKMRYHDPVAANSFWRNSSGAND